ncbi:FGGY family carbohydrate kinase [Halomarina halobia]|uniref:FGGY family carbohydrate kinase n=1 Tax=Halomarina halobia TaxID=3033386 RepID=A0ABD6ADW5_9EURY|nr:FGGY family carbohydrate kinase [Halomarina sp. PSR21]
MSETYLVGIDLALSSVRVTAYDWNGDVALSGTADIAEQSPAGWERAVREAAVFLPRARIVVSTIGTSGTVVTVDEYGNPIFEPRWYYETEPEQADELLDLDTVQELSSKGLSLSAASPLAKVLALRERNPDRFDDVEWILSPATWLLYRLRYPTGRRWTDLETDWTNALKFGADITRSAPDWFEPLFDAVDVPLDLLPAIRRPGTTVGHAESEFAADVGLRDAELYHGLTDGNASVLASGCLYPGDCSIVCGSTSVVKYVSETIEPHDALYYHRHPIEGYLPGAAFDTGVVLRWLCEQVLDIRQERGLELARAVDSDDEPRVYLQGNRSPFFDPGMGTTLLDLWPDDERSIGETRGRLVRGLVSSIALSEYTYFPILEEHFGEAVDRIHLVSGGEPAGDDPFSWWNTLRASIWDREVLKMEPRTTVGPLIPAALTASVYEDVDEASEQLLRVNGKVRADDDLREEYEPVKRRFASEWRLIADLYEDLK